MLIKSLNAFQVTLTKLGTRAMQNDFFQQVSMGPAQSRGWAGSFHILYLVGKSWNGPEPGSEHEDTAPSSTGFAKTLQVPGTRRERGIPAVAMETQEEVPGQQLRCPQHPPG